MTVTLPQTQTQGLRLAIAPLSGFVVPLLFVPRSWMQAGTRNPNDGNAGKRKPASGVSPRERTMKT